MVTTTSCDGLSSSQVRDLYHNHVLSMLTFLLFIATAPSSCSAFHLRPPRSTTYHDNIILRNGDCSAQPSTTTSPTTTWWSYMYTSSPVLLCNTALYAKKRRRRKNQSDSTNSGDNDADEGDDDASRPGGRFDSNDDLPEFDLKDDKVGSSSSSDRDSRPFAADLDATTAFKSSQRQTQQSSSSWSSSSSSKQQQPVKSIQELIADRSLEQKFEFDGQATRDKDDSGETLPDLVELMRSNNNNKNTAATLSDDSSSSSSGSEEGGGSTTTVVGKKKARQAERRAAALARQEEEEKGQRDVLTDLLGGIPFLVDEEKGQVTALKIIEAGTWFAIAVLISWEIYINSPFFERAAPLAPIVY